MSFRSGVVAFVGRPNAGKSTLMNRLLGEKVAIVSDKPQTTRHRLVGILTKEESQLVFLDTPGVHKPLHRLNRNMVRAAVDALNDADVVCLIVDATQRFGRGDEYVLDLMRRTRAPRLVALNKVDLMHKTKLLPLIASYAETGLFDEIVPISALDGDGCETLGGLLTERVPEGPPLYDAEMYTLHPERFLAAELIREQILEATRDELPYTTAVAIEAWEDIDERGLSKIHATILVEKPGQKAILVGHKGSQIKRVGTAARLQLEALLGRRVYLDLHVKCQPDWRESRRILAEIDRYVLPVALADAGR